MVCNVFPRPYVIQLSIATDIESSNTAYHLISEDTIQAVVVQ
jgi:hypothetical protein